MAKQKSSRRNLQGREHSFQWRVQPRQIGGRTMGRGILLWMLGIPLPIIILLAFFR